MVYKFVLMESWTPAFTKDEKGESTGSLQANDVQTQTVTVKHDQVFYKELHDLL